MKYSTQTSTHAKPRLLGEELTQALRLYQQTTPAKVNQIHGKVYECERCKDLGWIRYDLPVNDPNFGKMHPCECRTKEIQAYRNRNLFSICQLEELRLLTFDNFQSMGLPGNDDYQRRSIERAYHKALGYAKEPNAPKGWFFLVGYYGSGKTHLAAAVANFLAQYSNVETLFVTVPALLDKLRSAYDDEALDFQNLLEQVQSVSFLVLDDFGAEQKTDWAKEKLFQIFNRRYINQLPTMITSNLQKEEMERRYPRILSRINDASLTIIAAIEAGDQRSKKRRKIS